MLYVATKIIGKANAVKSVSNLPIPSNPKIKLPLFIYFRVYDALFKAKYFASSLKYKLANEIHKVNQICECNQDPKEAYLIPCEIIGFNETFDIHYFKLDQLNSEQEYFLDKFPKVIQLIERFNVIKTFHNLLFNNQMDTNT